MRHLPVTAAVIVCLAVVAALAAEEEAGNAVLAKVNDRLVTRHDVDVLLAMSGELGRIKNKYHGEELEKQKAKAFNNTLASLVNEAVYLINAQLDGVRFDDIEEKQAEHMLRKDIERYGTQANFEFVLKRRGLTIDDVKERTRNTLLREKYKRRKLFVDTFISPGEARQYYEKNKSLFRRRPTVTYRKIVIMFGPDSQDNRTKPEARKLIADILTDLKNGADFETLARQLSEGPNKDEGGLRVDKAEEDLIEEIAMAIADLKEGEITGVIERTDEFAIVTVEGRDKSLYKTFEKALEKITRDLRKTRREEKFPEFQKEIYSRVEIELMYAGATLEELCPAYAKTRGQKQDAKQERAP